MRTRYHKDLEQLANLLHELCLRDRAVVATASNALINADLEQAERAIDLGRGITAMSEACEREAVRLLALQAPVAGELRRVVTAVQLVGDLARMGALAEHIAVVARRRHPAHAVPEPVRPLIARMGAAAVAMAGGAAAVLESGDPGDAAQLDSADDAMDRLHQELLTRVLGEDWSHGTTAVVDLTLLGRYYERFADHTVEVGRRTIFMATGQSPDEWMARGCDLH
ncbi:phosphate signaling complex protein PhoU [Nocardia amamiensis]|uniref:Phosphate signaling complex protein PhoU n=1 Tax=Nocardia amamiensis TaxID=404578 RepID=A0ABS0D1U0_9NOCA|nr:phosphate signaling complex protein PhoU [Nocardia amamiensis]MBF6302813.1 phosphate signaling complex protein PhoU [Nocardia amamiensis]